MTYRARKLLGTSGGRVGVMTIKEYKGTFVGDENDLHLDCGGGDMGACIYRNLLNCTFKIGAFITCKLHLNRI